MMSSSYLPLLLLLFSFILLSSAAPFRLPLRSPWDAFKQLSGSRIGDHNPAIILLKSYLSNYGYIPANSTTIANGDFDDILETALSTYQRNFGLNVSGALDLSTIDQLISPRCGVADIINGTSSMASAGPHGRQLFAYFPGTPTWPRRALTYAFTSTSAVPISDATLRVVFARAFARWSDATTLNFREIDNPSKADITIGFFNGGHGDGAPFDGVLGTLAHAFSPPSGLFHLDAAEEWVAEGDVSAASSEVAVDLESVAVHEIGHLLGLGHSSAPEAIMFPTIKTRTRKVELTRDDVEGIQGLYGGNPNFTVGTIPTPASTRMERYASEAGVGSWRELGVWKLLAGVVVALLIM